MLPDSLSNHWQRARAEAIDFGIGSDADTVYDLFKKRLELADGEQEPVYNKLKNLGESYTTHYSESRLKPYQPYFP